SPRTPPPTLFPYTTLFRSAVDAAQKYLELAITRYRGGVTSYLEVTTAQSAALSDEVTAVNILGRRMVSAVGLIQALGGSWDRSRSESTRLNSSHQIISYAV